MQQTLSAARRISNLSPYLFAEANGKIAEKMAAGVDVISLGVGDPDLPTPPHIIRALQEAAQEPANHRYPDYYGLKALREAIADWYARRFGVCLDPDTEVLPLIGSKEGIAHMAVAFADPGDVVLCPDPGYPVYSGGSVLAGAVVHPMPLEARSGFLPDLDAVPEGVARKAKLMWLNYPNNPTAATAPMEFFDQAVAFARKHGVLVCHDNAYSEVSYDGYVAPSFLQASGATEIGVEFHSLSKTYNMSGWRIGMAVGNAGALEALGRVKTNIDSGVFQAVQRASIAALQGDQTWIRQRNEVYQRRRDLVVEALRSMGVTVVPPRASLYVWAPVPAGAGSSMEFSLRLLDDAGIWVTPGVGFGPHGEGYVRISLTVPDNRLAEAMGRVGLPRVWTGG